MFKRVAIAASAGFAALGALMSVANANTITISGDNGTITCSGSVEPACEAYTLGASGGLDTTPDGVGTLSTTLAWYYKGTPSNESNEAARLYTLSGGTVDYTSGPYYKDETPSMSFTTLAEWVLLKVGNSDVFIHNLTGGELTINITDLASAFGLSHITFFGEVSDVPLPAAAWLMMAGIGGLGFESRKKKAA